MIFLFFILGDVCHVVLIRDIYFQFSDVVRYLQRLVRVVLPRVLRFPLTLRI